MGQTDYGVFEAKTPADRTVMHVLYGMHTVAPFTLWTLSLVALVIHYVKRSDEHDPLYLAHHNFMIRTVWWSALWLVLTTPLWFLFLLPGMFAWMLVGAWYLYRCLKGWLRFNDNRLPEEFA